MANTKQAKKMIRKTEKRTQYNRWWKTNVKNALKEAQSGDAEAVKKLQKTVDKAVKSGVLHKNKGSRVKSAAMKLLQSK